MSLRNVVNGAKEVMTSSLKEGKSTVVNILGAGSMGCILAHELAKSEQVAPVLFLKSPARLRGFKADGSKIQLTRSKNGDVESSSAELEALVTPSQATQQSFEKIENLVISTKSYVTKRALTHCVPLLDENSNVLILQNGMGMADELRQEFWPNSWNAPTFYEAISTHGAYKRGPNQVNHVGLGRLTIAPAHGNLPFRSYKEPPLMIQAILDRPELNASYVAQSDMVITQLEKLVVNACINPNTALLDCLNGDLLYGSRMTKVMKRIIGEALRCFEAEFSVQLKGNPEAASRLNLETLQKTVFDVIKTTAQNSSSMREDVRQNNFTEIDAINGYISRLGKKHNIPTYTNDMLVNMIYNKVSIDRGIENAALERAVKKE